MGESRRRQRDRLAPSAPEGDDMAPTQFGGVYAATTTPFSPDGALDLSGFEKHCLRLVENGVSGIVPNGSLCEYEALDDAERVRLVEAAQATVGDRVPVVPGVSGR